MRLKKGSRIYILSKTLLFCPFQKYYGRSLVQTMAYPYQKKYSLNHVYSETAAFSANQKHYYLDITHISTALSSLLNTRSLPTKYVISVHPTNLDISVLSPTLTARHFPENFDIMALVANHDIRSFFANTDTRALFANHDIMTLEGNHDIMAHVANFDTRELFANFDIIAHVANLDTMALFANLDTRVIFSQLSYHGTCCHPEQPRHQGSNNLT